MSQVTKASLPLTQTYAGTSSSLDPGAGKSMRAIRRFATTNEINIGRGHSEAGRLCSGIGLSTQTRLLRACQSATASSIECVAHRLHKAQKSPSMLYVSDFVQGVIKTRSRSTSSGQTTVKLPSPKAPFIRDGGFLGSTALESVPGNSGRRHPLPYDQTCTNPSPSPSEQSMHMMLYRLGRTSKSQISPTAGLSLASAFSNGYCVPLQLQCK